LTGRFDCSPLFQLVAPSSFAVLPPSFSRRPEASLFDLEQPQVSPNSSTPSTSDAPSTSSSSPFVAHHAAFLPLLGPSPTLTVLAEDPDGISFAHEAPVWWKETAEVSFSANVLGKGGEDPFDVRSPIYKVNLEGRLSEEVRMRPSIPMPNGAIRFGDRILWSVPRSLLSRQVRKLESSKRSESTRSLDACIPIIQVRSRSKQRRAVCSCSLQSFHRRNGGTPGKLLSEAHTRHTLSI
jgi:hypothetical protein